MTLPATDSFDRANAGTLGSNWTDYVTLVQLGIIGNEAGQVSGGNYGMAEWNADVFPDDHASQAIIVNHVGTAPQVGLLVRSVASLGNNYFLLHDFAGPPANTAYLYKTAGGSFTLLQTIGAVAVTSDLLKAQAVGTTIKAMVNGAQVGVDQVDGTYPSGGAAGIAAFTDGRLNDWQGGRAQQRFFLSPN